MRLQEFVQEDLELLESEGDTGLPKFRGIFQKCDEENRNGRIYSSELWEQVLNSDKIQSKLDNRTMLGELNHPDYRDPNPENASHVVTKLWLSEDKKLVYGEAEILDTPKGRILESLLRAGVQIGVSSRGEGKMVKREGQDYVEEDSYDLITFDGVLEPSVVEAQPSLIESRFGSTISNMLNEGKLGEKELDVLEDLSENFSDREIADALKTQILEAKTKIDNNNSEENNNMSGSEKTLERLQQRNEELSEAKEDLVRAEEKNKNLRNQLAEAKVAKKKAQKQLKKYKKIAESVPALQSKLDKIEENYNKAIKVVEGLKQAFDEKSSALAEKERYYQKALSVLEGVKSKMNSTKVEDFLDEELADVGGLEKFRNIIGDVESLSLEEAKKKVDNIKELLGENSESKIFGKGELKLREKENNDDDKDKKRKSKKNALVESKNERESTASILNQM